MNIRKNLSGMQFDRLKVLKPCGKANNGKILYLCKCSCGSEVIAKYGDLKYGYKRSCGCLKKETIITLNKKRIGILLSEPHRQKLKIARKGKKPYLGKKHTEETRKRISLATKGENNPMYGVHLYGEKSGNWKDGITPIHLRIRASDQYIKWRKQVFERDKYICQKCGRKGGDVNAHHVIPFAERIDLVLDIDSGITLCVVCHKKHHTLGLRLSRGGMDTIDNA